MPVMPGKILPYIKGLQIRGAGLGTWGAWGRGMGSVLWSSRPAGTTGALAGGLYGAMSDNTSVLGGAAMGFGIGRYGGAGLRAMRGIGAGLPFGAHARAMFGAGLRGMSGMARGDISRAWNYGVSRGGIWGRRLYRGYNRVASTLRR